MMTLYHCIIDFGDSYLVILHYIVNKHYAMQCNATKETLLVTSSFRSNFDWIFIAIYSISYVTVYLKTIVFNSTPVIVAPVFFIFCIWKVYKLYYLTLWFQFLTSIHWIVLLSLNGQIKSRNNVICVLWMLIKC